ncbi:MAG TPA: 2-dehydropantoate 2-reductase [Acidimicrobiales bacterium]|nr:2-dehydropantoate 2-reductase [Acidimicrobiales bacterium]
MANARRYAVIGTGAIGGLYGARLGAQGFDVAFLGRSDVDALRRDGLSVTSPTGDIVLDSVTADSDPKKIGPVDVVLVTIKTTGQAALAGLLPPLVAPGTIVVLMQNGFGLEADVAALAPEATILGGMCFVCATRTAPGRIDHLDYGGVTVGEHTDDGSPAGVTDAVEGVVADFTQAGIEITARADLLAARWQKLVWNMPFNGLSVVLDAGTDEMVADTRLCVLVRALMDEVALVSVAHGHPVGDHFVDKMITDTEAMTPYAPSMKLDFDAGRPLELAAIYDAPLAVAASLDVATPHLSALAGVLHFLGARNRR